MLIESKRERPSMRTGVFTSAVVALVCVSSVFLIFLVVTAQRLDATPGGWISR